MSALVLYVVTLALAGAMLAVLYRTRTTAPAWVGHYYHYLLFFYLGTLAGQVLPLVIAELLAPSRSVHPGLFWLIQATLAFPLSVAALYWFIAFAFGLAGRAVPRHLAIAYGFVSGAAVLAFLAWTAWIITGTATMRTHTLYETGMTTGAGVLVALSVWAALAVAREPDERHRRFVRWFVALLVGGVLVKVAVVTVSGAAERWHEFLRTLLNLPSFVLLVRHIGRGCDLAPGEPPRATLSDPELASRLGITRREVDVVRLLCDGCSNKEIAAQLGIALQTVKQHIYNVYQKLHVENRVQLANRVRGAAEAPSPDERTDGRDTPPSTAT